MQHVIPADDCCFEEDDDELEEFNVEQMGFPHVCAMLNDLNLWTADCVH